MAQVTEMHVEEVHHIEEDVEDVEQTEEEVHVCNILFSFFLFLAVIFYLEL